MGLTDDPFYRNMTEGEDTPIIIGTLTTRMRSPKSGRIEILPLFLIDYYSAPQEMERFAADTFDKLKKINLTVKEGVYTLEVDERNTTLVFGGGEVASHTAANFWAQYTPAPDEHQAFQEAFKATGVWVLMIVTKPRLREFLILESGEIVYRNSIPLTPELKKVLKIEE